MKVINSINEMKTLRKQVSGTVGFVPTMGYLHDGHLELVRRAKSETPVAVVSIFVNPTQFGPQEDFKQYLRDLDRDLSLLDSVRTDIVFIPGAGEMYPPDFNTWVVVDKITERLEGAVRPGHFRGVATVVAKLFNIVQPDKAYFGQKDAQQVIVIKKMVADLNMNLEIVTVPTVREPDGLAMSSRNIYLNPEERKAAVVLYQALNLALQLYRNGEKDARKIRERMAGLIRREPLAEIDYVSIASAWSLGELDIIKSPAVISLAVRIGKTRLIDNIMLD